MPQGGFEPRLKTNIVFKGLIQKKEKKNRKGDELTRQD